ncbi:MAG: helix-turn-helix domain-containing protein [Ruminococcaceae bacterium]|nr:helix-turn-helix domain-containing protein [Oscillospiraceae bacterium]
MYRYESHAGLIDPDFPVIFHFNHLEGDSFFSHWHENIELLYILEGSAQVTSDQVSLPVKAGQIAVVNSNHIHTVLPEGAVSFYCLIIDKQFLETFGIDVEKNVFKRVIDAPKALELYLQIADEIQKKSDYYEAQVRSLVVSLLVLMKRECVTFTAALSDTAPDRKLSTAKEVLRYLQKHYREQISLEQVAECVGFNKYYLAHLFKETVGCSVVQYLNYLRCSYAKNLLQTTSQTVAEVAEACGFFNLSYFSRTYKKHMSVLPRDEKRL